jgi:hypothetical protein
MIKANLSSGTGLNLLVAGAESPPFLPHEQYISGINMENLPSSADYLRFMAEKVTVLVEELAVLVEEKSVLFEEKSNVLEEKLENFSQELNKARLYCLNSGSLLEDLFHECAHISTLMKYIDVDDQKMEVSSFSQKLNECANKLDLVSRNTVFLQAFSSDATSDENSLLQVSSKESQNKCGHTTAVDNLQKTNDDNWNFNTWFSTDEDPITVPTLNDVQSQNVESSSEFGLPPENLTDSFF